MLVRFTVCRITWTNGASGHLTASANEFTTHEPVNECPHFLLDVSAIRSLKATYEITLNDRITSRHFELEHNVTWYSHNFRSIIRAAAVWDVVQLFEPRTPFNAQGIHMSGVSTVCMLHLPKQADNLNGDLWSEFTKLCIRVLPPHNWTKMFLVIFYKKTCWKTKNTWTFSIQNRPMD
jgi:hypothetical protein